MTSRAPTTPNRFQVAALVAAILFGAPPARAHESPVAHVDRLTRAIAATPDRAQLYLERGELVRLQGDLDAAAADFDRAGALEPDLPRLALCRAALALDRGQVDAALAGVDRFLTAMPEDRNGWNLRARIHDAMANPGAAAGDRRRALAIAGHHPAPLAAPFTPLLPPGAAWRWLATATDPGTAWRGAGFNDSAWPSGPAPLGYGETYIATPVPYGPDANNKWPTTAFRAHFQLASVPVGLTTLRLTARYDDGFVAWLNGVEVARRALAAGSTWTTWATNHEAGTSETIDISPFIGLLAPGDNVLAVEVHQTNATSSDLVWDGSLSYSTSATLTRGPYLQAGTPTSIVVRWRTNVATDSRVRFGQAPGALTSFMDDPAVDTEHEVTLYGLTPDTRFYYSVGSTADTLAGDASYTFRTSPTGPKATRFWAIGDSGDDSYNGAVRRGWFRYSHDAMPDFWLMLGDNAYDAGTDAEYQVGVFDSFPTLLRASVLWPTRGNHDILYSGPANDYYDIFTLPEAGEAGGVASGSEAYHSWDYGDIHFICLDSEGSDRTPGSPMLTWLAGDLAANTQGWTIAYWHHPPYSRGSHDSDTEPELIDMRQNALPILEAGGIDLVLTGHSHSYERSMLLDQHYGESWTLADSMRLDSGDGRPTSDGAYFKPTAGHAAPHEGAVYAVAGSSSRLGGGPHDHPVMITSLNMLGSMAISIDGPQLDAVFIDTLGIVRDNFTIIKGAPTGVSEHRYGGPTGPELQPGAPNPFARSCHLTFSLTAPGRVTIRIFDAAGRLVRRLLDEPRSAGEFRLAWDAADERGAAVAPGVYFVQMSAAGVERTQRVVVSR